MWQGLWLRQAARHIRCHFTLVLARIIVVLKVYFRIEHQICLLKPHIIIKVCFTCQCYTVEILIPAKWLVVAD